MDECRSIEVSCPAKLNLALAVDAPNASGMHPIASWMVTLSWGDTLHITRVPPQSLSAYAIQWAKDAPRRSDIDWPISRDLAFRAHQALESHVGHSLPIRMRLDKRIPVGGGLGGGSSNAAAMLRGLNEIFDLRLQDVVLGSIAASLGSDVPFLVRGGSSIVRGLGEHLEHMDSVPDLHVTLAFPEAICPTGQVYRTFDQLLLAASATHLGDFGVRAARVSSMARSAAVEARAPFNDLAHAARQVAPAMQEAAIALATLAGSPAHVCGSGSSLFCVSETEHSAKDLAARIRCEMGIPALSCRAAPA